MLLIAQGFDCAKRLDPVQFDFYRVRLSTMVAVRHYSRVGYPNGGSTRI